MAVLPVSRDIRWWIVLLAGWSFPFVYALKLGQVGPILFATFAIGWRWLDQPTILGLSGALGAAIKIQPGLILLWALLTRRWRAVVIGGAALLVLAGLSVLLAGFGSWTDFLSLLRTVSDPITTEHNLTPGAVAYRLGVPAGPSAALQALAIVAALGALLASIRWCTSEASYLAAVIVSQLISPILWDHYAMLLLLPVAYLLGRRPVVGAGHPAGHRLAARRGHAQRRLPAGLRADPRRGRVGRATPGRVDRRRARRPTDDDRVARHVTRRLDRETLVGLGLVAISALVYWLANRDFDAGRGDFFYLADAFNHGRAWLDVRLGPNDVIVVDGHFYVPFAPFPAVAFMPLVALIGPVTADQLESGINALLAASGVGLCWWYLGRLGVDPPGRPAVAGRPVRVLDPDPVGHDARRRVAHRPPRGDDPDLRLSHRAARGAPGVAHRPAGRGRLPDPGAAGLRHPGLRAVPGATRRPARPAALAVAGRGSASGWAWPRRSSRSSPTTRSASGRRSSRATRWRRCRPSSRPSASAACSRSCTSR